MSITEKIAKDAEDIVFVYTICGSLEEARDLGFSCIEEKHAISMDYTFYLSMAGIYKRNRPVYANVCNSKSFK